MSEQKHINGHFNSLKQQTNNKLNIQIAGHDVILLPEKAIWIITQKTLVISDLHLGKIEHFRKNGIAMPIAAGTKTLNDLNVLMNRLIPERVIFLGDLFHSTKNASYDQFYSFLQNFPSTAFQLVIGNHDILHTADYTFLNMEISKDIVIDNLYLTHESLIAPLNNQYCIAGHLHPGISIKGKAKQQFTLPCFYVGKYQAVLPAFGYFTGKAIVKKEKDVARFAIADNNVFRI